MIERQIQMAEGARLTLSEMAGNVALAGWGETDVLIRLRDGQEEQLVVEDSEGGPAVSAQVACEVHVPVALPVAVRQARANLNVKGLADLNAEQVRGNLRLSEVNEAVIAEVYGNLKAKAVTSLRLVGTVYGEAGLKAVQAADLQNVRGNLQAREVERLRVSRVGGNLQAREIGHTLDADQVGGNALLKGAGGVVTLNQVAGNLVAKDLIGGAKVARVGGNLVLNGDLGTGCTYHFQADGNAVLRLTEEASAHLTLSARGQMLSAMTLADEEREEGRLSGTLGDGGAEIVVEAKGNVLLGGVGPAIGVGLGEEIARQVEESLHAVDLEAIGQQVSKEMEQAMSRLQVKLEGMDWDRIGYRTHEAVERAMERMQRDVDRLAKKEARHQERLRRMAEKEARLQEKLGRKAQRRAHHRPRPEVTVEIEDWGGESEAEPIKPEPSLDEERLSILKMVEQGQITPEDAEMLLVALG